MPNVIKENIGGCGEGNAYNSPLIWKHRFWGGLIFHCDTCTAENLSIKCSVLKQLSLIHDS